MENLEREVVTVGELIIKGLAKFGAVTVVCAFLLWTIHGPGGFVEYMQGTLTTKLDKIVQGLEDVTNGLTSHEKAVRELTYNLSKTPREPARGNRHREMEYSP